MIHRAKLGGCSSSKQWGRGNLTPEAKCASRTVKVCHTCNASLPSVSTFNPQWREETKCEHVHHPGDVPCTIVHFSCNNCKNRFARAKLVRTHESFRGLTCQPGNVCPSILWAGKWKSTLAKHFKQIKMQRCNTTCKTQVLESRKAARPWRRCHSKEKIADFKSRLEEHGMLRHRHWGQVLTGQCLCFMHKSSAVVEVQVVQEVQLLLLSRGRCLSCMLLAYQTSF